MIILAVSSFVMFILFYKQEHRLLYPGTIFNLWWGIIIAVDVINPYKLYQISNEAIWIITLGWLVFNIVCIISLSKKKTAWNINASENNQPITFECNVSNLSNKLYTVQIILIISLIPLLVRIIPLYFNYSVLEIRNAAAAAEFSDSMVYMTTFERLFYFHWIVFPLIKSLFTVTLILWLIRKIKPKVFLLSIINMILVILISGSRLPAFFVAIMMIFSVIEFEKHRINKQQQVIYKSFNKKKKAIGLFILFAIIYMGINGYLRSSTTTTLISSMTKSIVVYFTGGMHLFSSALENKDAFGLNEHSYFIITFRGIFAIISQLLYYLSGRTIPLFIDKFTLSYLDTNYLISDTISINAFPTMYYYFMRDMGILGIIIFTGLFAFASNRIYRTYLKTRTVSSLVFLMEIGYIILFSVCCWLPIKQEYTMQIVYYILIFKVLTSKKKVNIPCEQRKSIIAINTCTNGSTGRVMLDIAKKARCSGYKYITFSPKRRKYNKQINNHVYFGCWLDTSISVRLSILTGLNGCFSFINTLSLYRYLNKIKPDAIHIHNLHDNYINLSMLFKYIKRNDIKVIWTLHDCWSFTGGCPYFTLSGCEEWKKSCKHCVGFSYPSGRAKSSEIILKKKKKIFSNVKSMTIVTPSSWLGDLAGKSFLSQYKVVTINNGINISVFKPTESDIAEKYGIKSKYIILGVAMPWSYRKGLDVFISLSEQLGDDFHIVIVGTDQNIDKQLPQNVTSIHHTNNLTELVKIYSMANLFVNPTREENFPTVNIESLACGTPVVTYQTGGSPEIIDDTCGSVVGCNDFETLKKEIIRICTSSVYTKEACIKRAKLFDSSEKYTEYVNLYKEILSDNKNNLLGAIHE